MHLPLDTLLAIQGQTADLTGMAGRWAAGCIIAEMRRGRALFPGRTLYHQLDLMTNVLGHPPTQIVNSFRNKRAKSYLQSQKERSPVDLRQCFANGLWDGQGISNAELDLLSVLLQLDPRERASASIAVHHPYFDPRCQKTLPNSEPQMLSGVPSPIIPELTAADFFYEKQKLTVPQLRAVLWEEIMRHNGMGSASPSFRPGAASRWA